MTRIVRIGRRWLNLELLCYAEWDIPDVFATKTQSSSKPKLRLGFVGTTEIIMEDEQHIHQMLQVLQAEERFKDIADTEFVSYTTANAPESDDFKQNWESVSNES